MTTSHPTLSGDDLLVHSGSSAGLSKEIFSTRGQSAARRPAQPLKPASEESEEELVPDHGADDSGFETRTKAILSNPRWNCSEGVFDRKVTVTVDITIPKEIEFKTKVDFDCWPVLKGVRNPRKATASSHAKDGTASASFILDRPTDPDTGELLDACDFRFRASHSSAEPVTASTLPVKAVQEVPFDGVIFYSMQEKDYVIGETEEDMEILIAHMKGLADLRKDMEKAWHIEDAAQRQVALEEVGKKSESLLNDKSLGSAKRGLEELLLVQGNTRLERSFQGWSFVPSGTVGAKDGETGLRRLSPEKAQAYLDKLLKRGMKENRRSDLISGKFKANLFEKDPIVAAVWQWKKPKEKSESGDAPAFSHEAEAALFRFCTGWDGGEVSWDPKKKKLSMGASGHVSGSIFEGKTSAKLELPGPKGFNLLSLLEGVKNKEVFLRDPQRQCLVKLALEGSFTAFFGAKIEGAAALRLESFKKAEIEGGGDAFAGAHVTAGAKGKVAWSPSPSVQFQDLASLGFEAGASAGIGLVSKLNIGYDRGRFQFEAACGITFGLGSSGKFKWEVDGMQGALLVGHLCSNVNYHFIAEISRDAFTAYTNYAYAHQTAQFQMYRSQAELAMAGYSEFKKALSGLGSKVKDLKWAISNSSLSHATLAKVPPEALARSILSIMELREPTDFKTIMNLLRSTVIKRYDPVINPTANHKLKWTLRHLSGMDLYGTDGPARENAKQKALEKGIVILKDFGRGEGIWKTHKYNTSKDDFPFELNGFLKDSGIHQ